MANYKNIRLEEHVYRMLEKRMRPRESMSQVVERLINILSSIQVLAQGVVKKLEEDE